MSKSSKVKALLSLKDKKGVDFANALGLSKPQALTTKYSREAFSSDDLIKLSQLTNTRLAFIDNKTNKELISFDETDIKKDDHLNT